MRKRAACQKPRAQSDIRRRQSPAETEFQSNIDYGKVFSGGSFDVGFAEVAVLCEAYGEAIAILERGLDAALDALLESDNPAECLLELLEKAQAPQRP